MNINRENIFLIDGFGALVSAILLGLILPTFQELIGMPTPTLYLLGFGAFIFMLYSSFCLKFANLKNPMWLRIIMIANLGYCTLTAVLVFHHFEVMTDLGISYFVGEIIIILGLVTYEQRFSRISG